MACNPAIRDWAAQRVWIVGASSGIGAALARELVARGARVAVSARSAAGKGRWTWPRSAMPSAPTCSSTASTPSSEVPDISPT